MRSSKKQAFISSIMDLCAEIDRLCGTSLPTRSCREVGLEFHNRGYRDYNDDAPAFIEEIFADRWIWGEGGEVKRPELNAATMRRRGNLGLTAPAITDQLATALSQMMDFAWDQAQDLDETTSWKNGKWKEVNDAWRALKAYKAYKTNKVIYYEVKDPA